MEVQAQQNAKRLRLLVRKWVSLNAMSLSFMLLVSLSYCALSFYLLKEPFFIYFVNLVLSKIYRRRQAERERPDPRADLARAVDDRGP